MSRPNKRALISLATLLLVAQICHCCALGGAVGLSSNPRRSVLWGEVNDERVQRAHTILTRTATPEFS